MNNRNSALKYAVQSLPSSIQASNQTKNPNRPLPILPKPGMLNSNAGGSITNGTNASDSMMSVNNGSSALRDEGSSMHESTHSSKMTREKIPSSLLYHQKVR
jgi:hypothetical protein